jgi:hypothetical protein
MHGAAAEALDLRSSRALTAGLAFFGIGGLLGMQLGLSWVVAIPLAIVLGFGAQAGTAVALRGMLRLEEDRTMSLYQAVGTSGTVYLAVPSAGTGVGKVHVVVQERLVECAAVTLDDGIPTGAPVLVVDVDENRPDTLVVVRQSPLSEENDVRV